MLISKRILSNDFRLPPEEQSRTPSRQGLKLPEIAAHPSALLEKQEFLNFGFHLAVENNDIIIKQ